MGFNTIMEKAKTTMARRRAEKLNEIFSDVIADAPAHFPRPRVLAPLANKGGVGKTMTSRIVAEAIALHIAPKLKVPNNRVLICDLDPQCNLSSRYLTMEIARMKPGDLRSPYVPPKHPDLDGVVPDDEAFSSITDVVYREGPIPYTTHIPHLDVVPAWGLGISEIETIRADSIDYKIAMDEMRKWVASPEIAEKYCLIVLDTAPRLNLLTAMTLRAATHVYIPYRPEPQGLQGVGVMMSAISDEAIDARPASDPLKLLGIFPNAVDRRTVLHRNFLQYLYDNYDLRDYITSCLFSDLKAHYAESDYLGRDPADLLQTNPESKVFSEVTEAVREFAWALGFLRNRHVEPALSATA